MTIIYHVNMEDIKNYMFTWIYKCTQIYLKPPLDRFMTMYFIIINNKLLGNRTYLVKYWLTDLKEKPRIWERTESSKCLNLVIIKPQLLWGLNGSPVPFCSMSQWSQNRNAIDLILTWSQNKSSKNHVRGTNVLSLSIWQIIWDSTDRVCTILIEQKEANLFTHILCVVGK